ncbi:MAG: outer membrane insertion C- signal [Reichenbachiella sp.]|uniref:outer membrane insertion C- signal n=1 Tax=Reichenbachiella sp. TaxID=2184521 RepID=UPI0032668E77
MKKYILVLAIVLLPLFTSQAQEIGIRLGDVLGNDAAVDFVLPTGNSSRLHADVSFGDHVGAEVLYDFLYKRLGDTPNLNWYVGVGPSALFADDLFLGASGEIGLEYHFDFPMAIGADWRPTFWLIEETDFRGDSFGLNIRYVFNR